MEIEGSVALVTGASRGIGLAFARALLSRGAARVYAGVRRPEDFHEPGVEPLLLDVTNHQHIEAAAARACDAGIVINNAGIIAGPELLHGSLDGARREMEVNYLAPWALSRAFAPVPRPFQDHDVSPRMVNGRSMERPAHRVASVTSVRPAIRSAPIARLRRAAMTLGPFRVLTLDLSS